MMRPALSPAGAFPRSWRWVSVIFATLYIGGFSCIRYRFDTQCFTNGIHRADMRYAADVNGAPPLHWTVDAVDR